MLVHLLHLIPERFLTFCQHAKEWIVEVSMKLRQAYVVLLAAIEIVLLVPVSNLKRYQSAAVLVVHYQKEMKATTIEKETEINI